LQLIAFKPEEMRQIPLKTMFTVLLLTFFVVVANGGFLAFLKFPSLQSILRKESFSPNEASSATTRFLPKLPPHKDTSFFLEFVTDNSEPCKLMEPVVKRLEKDLNIKTRKIDISKRRDFMKLYEVVGGNECGSVPFYYNRRTSQAVCGPTTYLNLKRLAMGSPEHLFQDAPQNAHEKQEYDPRRQRGVGLGDYLTEQLLRKMSSLTKQL
jgi:thiol-disulfide isomerase/thioredoxin